jgi:hypothetical protein
VEPLDHALAAFDDLHLQVGDGSVRLHAPDRSLALFSVGRLTDQKALRFESATQDRSSVRVVRDQQDELAID